jgi:hypothetical protein
VPQYAYRSIFYGDLRLCAGHCHNSFIAERTATFHHAGDVNHCAAGYAVAQYFKAQRVQRIGQIFLEMMLGVSWVQARMHWVVPQTGQAVYGEP